MYHNSFQTPGAPQFPRLEYRALEEFIAMMPSNRREPCEAIIGEHHDRLHAALGSRNNHHNWEGGWWDHTTEIMNLGVALYGAINANREWPFRFEDTIFPLFIHDLEKPWKYATNNELKSLNDCLYTKGYRVTLAFPKQEPHAFIIGLLEAYGVRLTEVEHNALEFAHGEVARYSPDHRFMQPIATFVHMCDVMSARVFYNYPLEEHHSDHHTDNWCAKRSK